MPVIPARKGFGPGKAGWSGWRDKVGMTIRPGPNVFVIVAHAAWGGVPAGRIPARLFRSFQLPLPAGRPPGQVPSRRRVHVVSQPRHAHGALGRHVYLLKLYRVLYEIGPARDVLT